MKKSHHFSLDKLLFLFLIFSFVISTVFKILSVSNNTSVITYDQGRDLIDIRHMVETRSPRLVGPTTSINGVLLGPFWYYFNLLPFIFSGGNPTVIAIWQILWYQFAVILFYQVLKKQNQKTAVIASTLFFLLPTAFYTSRYFWNANTMPTFVLLFFTSLIWFFQHKTLQRAFILGLVAGLGLQIEAAFGILLFPFAFLSSLFTSKFKKTIFFTSGFLVTLIPQMLFEFRHGFVMTNLLVHQFTGKGDILGARLTFTERVNERLFLLTNTLRDLSHIPEKILFPSILITFLFFCLRLVKNKTLDKSKTLPILTFSFLIFSFLFYLFFPQHLKVWYILGLSIPLLLVFAVSLSSLPKWFFLAFTLFAIFHTYTAQKEYLDKHVYAQSNNPSTLRNQLSVIDSTYQQANSQAFKAYIYVPAIYDYAYQYLFWWYGQKKYGYMPTELAYLPNQPEYIEDAMVFLKNSKKLETNSPIFLIIENPIYSEFLQQWLGNFAKYCETSKQSFSFNVDIKLLHNCSK